MLALSMGEDSGDASRTTEEALIIEVTQKSMDGCMD